MTYNQTLEWADPEEIAGRLGLAIVNWRDGILYVRDEQFLYSITPVIPSPDDAPSAKPRMQVTKQPEFYGYIGEEYHEPWEAAAHAGLTVIDGMHTNRAATALDGFGREYLIHKTGNGPIGASGGFASKEVIEKWNPQHRPWKRTET